MYLSRGQRVKLSEITQAKTFLIKVTAESGISSKYDINCIGVDENNNCPDIKYLICQNQKKSPCGGIMLLSQGINHSETFQIDISKFPEKIKKLVFTISSEEQASMAKLKECSLLLIENDNIKGGFKFSGSDFAQEKSIKISEIYLKDDWRMSAVGQGFNGGFNALLEHFKIRKNELSFIENAPDITDIKSMDILTEEIKKLDEFSLEAKLGHITGFAGKLDFSLIAKGGRAYIQIYASDPTNMRKSGVLLNLDEKDFNQLKSIIARTDETIDKLKSSKQIKHLSKPY